MALLESGEMYLETMYILSRNHNCVRAVDISEYMSFSKPSVSRAISILKTEGYVTSDKNGCLFFTDEGRKRAEKIYARHTTFTRALIALGVDAETAEKDACRIEHVISEKTFQAVKNYFDSKDK